jgi:hypothetical protein
VGQTRVDLQHLLEDLRDAYPGPLEETILTEIVANALDSGAASVTLLTDAAAAVLVVVDDGKGMSRRDLSRYHDIATSSKRRGEGIGFAGVGIKLGLLVSAEVITETRRGSSHVATRWRLASRQKAPWRWIPPPGYVAAQGTAVCLRLQNPLSPLLDARVLEETLGRHFQPLMETAFDAILAERYPRGVAFRVNGHTLSRRPPPPGAETLEARLPRKRRAAALGYACRSQEPLPEGQRGIAVSTLGKVIRRGWDWLALAPDAHDRVAGLVEAPALAEALALNKADFLRSGPRGLLYLTYRKAIQEAVTAQLMAWGDRLAPEPSERRLTRPVERDLEDVLVDLAESFPALAALVERRAGGQRRLPTPQAGVRAAEGARLVATEPPEVESTAGAAAASEPAGSPREDGVAPSTLNTPGPAHGPRKPARYGVTLQLEEHPDNAQLGWLVDSTVHVNTAHPAYRRAVASRAEAYHLALTVGLSLAPLVAEPAGTQAFVTAFLARWGEALDRGGRGRRGRASRAVRKPRRG